jgi:signal transduction histidine kinase/ActR/RegA family two-component response regulator
VAKRGDRQLRSRAEATVARRGTKKSVASSQLSGELEIHRVELDLQNEELRGARAATEAALARYTEVFDFAPLGYAVLDVKRGIREINHVGASLLGVERGRLIGRRLDAYVAYGALAAFDALLIKAVTAPSSVQDELEMVRGGQPWAARITVAALSREDAMLLVAFEDVTESRRKEIELARSEQALREANQHKDDFIAMLSHELRNPLAPIQTCVSAMRQLPGGSPPPHRMLDILERSAQQLTRLVEDLLDVTRITSGKIQLHRVPVELVGLVSGALADFKLDFERHQLELETLIAEGQLWTLGDPVRLVQILTNLLTNAQKFTPEGGRVTVTLERRDARVWIRVRDSGIGVEPSRIAELFEPFVQAAQGLDRSRGGLGLGLAVARGLVELHGGHISMRSEGSGTGTEVSFDLPLELPNPATARAASESACGPRRVLIIEDHIDAAESLQLLLEMEGHDVQIAGDGPAGLARARVFVPEIVLCDLGLPGMDGFAVARAIRAEPALHDRYLVAISGYARPEDIRQSRAAGFDHHLAKPVSLAAIHAAFAAAAHQRIRGQVSDSR